MTAGRVVDMDHPDDTGQVGHLTQFRAAARHWEGPMRAIPSRADFYRFQGSGSTGLD